ncbi:MAG: 50S ribosomal protein L10 [Nitrospira sp.]|nr:50S ribosomal protein L10 [Nitrospira sp.]
MKKKGEKEKIIHDLHQKLSKAKLAILAEYAGLQVEALREIRNKLRGVGGEFRVVKNTLAKLAIPGTSLASILDHFQGPIAVIIGYDDPVIAAKVLKEFADREEKLKIKIGVLEGQLLDRQSLRTVAGLPSRERLRGDLVRRLHSPMANLVGGLKGVIRKLVFVLEAVKQKKPE